MAAGARSPWEDGLREEADGGTPAQAQRQIDEIIQRSLPVAVATSSGSRVDRGFACQYRLPTTVGLTDRTPRSVYGAASAIHRPACALDSNLEPVYAPHNMASNIVERRQLLAGSATEAESARGPHSRSPRQA
ncbi:uncharacterized protein LOC129587349 isoform X2 [Paramacrobiotus metropolitanus]|nr:uncharacterized protein LOC129587349 isoform X2 [Paramacrobiotus metropolitanus]